MGAEKELLLRINELIRKAEDGEINYKLAIMSIKVMMPNDQQIKEHFVFD